MNEKREQSVIIKKQIAEFKEKGGKIEVLNSIKSVDEVLARKGLFSHKKHAAIKMSGEGKTVKEISHTLGLRRMTVEGYLDGGKKDTGG